MFNLLETFGQLDKLSFSIIMERSVLLLLMALSVSQLEHIASAMEGSPRSFSGRHFVFSFPYPPDASLVSPYLIATAQTQGEKTEVHFELPALGCSQVTKIDYREVALFKLPGEETRSPPDDRFESHGDLRVQRTGDTVIVQASQNITLECVTAYHRDRFLVFPSDTLGVDYFIASSPIARSHQFTISTKVDQTKVNITTGDEVYGADNKTRHIGLVLHRNRSIHVTSLTDLTGVRVTSSNPVSVVSASRFGEVVLAQQLPPVEHWGRNFILAWPGSLPSPVVIYRVVVPQQNTTLSISSSGVTIDVRTGSGATWYDHSVHDGDGLDTLSSDKAVMIVRYTLATALLISPVELYTNSDGFELITSELPEPSMVLLNVAYLCEGEHNLNLSNEGELRPFRDVSLSSLDGALCVRTLAFRRNSGDADQAMHIRSLGPTATIAWVDTIDAEMAGSYRVAGRMQLYQPASEPVDSCTVVGSTDEPTVHTDISTTKRPSKSNDEVVVIVPLCVATAIVLAIIVGLCYYMKKNNMLPVCPCDKSRRAYDVSNVASNANLQMRPARPARPACTPEVIPLQNRYSMSLPDLRPSIPSNHRYTSGQRFLNVRLPLAGPLAPIAENEIITNVRASADCDTRMGQHQTFQHTYFSFNKQPAPDHRPPPDPHDTVRQPPPPQHGIPEFPTGLTQATDRSATGQFASIGKRRTSAAKPVPVQFVFPKPEIPSQ